MSDLSRRDFLKMSALAAAGVAAVACQPKTVVITKEVVKTVEVEKTVVVEKTVEVEKEVTKVVKMTVEVEKMVTAMPSEVHEAPNLFVDVAKGKLPPLEERLTQDPDVIEPVEEVGEYGGTWRRVSTGMGDVGGSVIRVCIATPFFWNRDATAVVPDVFKSVEIKDGGKTFVFGLRKGLKWSDGEPFTADDMIYLYEDIWKNEDLSPKGFGGWKGPEGNPSVMEKVDDYTFKWSFDSPYGLFMLRIATADYLLVPAHYMKQFNPKYAGKDKIEKAAQDAGFDTMDAYYFSKDNWRENSERPTLRPWIFSDTPQAGKQTFGFTRNPYYFKIDTEGNQLPYIDEIRYTFVETPEMLRLKAMAGEVDMQFRTINLASYPILSENAEKGDYRLMLWDALGTGMVIFPNHTLLKDDDVRALNQDRRWRVAISHLIDRDEINELVYMGMAGPVQECFPESFASEEKLWEPFKHDPKKANELLDELGLDKRDADGWRLLPNGKPLSITLEGFSQSTPVMDASELVMAKMQEAGINTGLKGITYDQWWDRIYTSEYQIVTYTKNNMGPLLQPIYPRAYTPVAHSTYWAPEWGNWYASEGQAGEEPTGTPRKLQEMFDQVVQTADEAKRVELFTQIYHLYLEFFPDIITVGRSPDPGVVKNNFRNVPDKCYQSWPLRTPALADPEQFFFKKS